MIMPNIYLKLPVYLKIIQIVKQCPKEVGWLGAVSVVDSKVSITDVYVPKQEVTSTTCEIDEEGLFAYSKIVGHEAIRYWGHSHANMGVTPSSQDNKEGKELIEHIDNFFITSIHNKSQDFSCRMYIPFLGLELPCKMVIDYDLDAPLDPEEIKKQVEEEMKNVEEKTYVYSYNKSQSRSRHIPDSRYDQPDWEDQYNWGWGYGSQGGRDFVEIRL